MRLNKNSKIIGITGGIGSGKTQVLTILEEQYGAYIIIADDVSRRLSQPGEISYTKIVDYFGPTLLLADGSIDRAKLAEIVFSDLRELEILNSFIHPYVKEDILRQIDLALLAGYPYIAIEAALLIEDGYQSICDELWFIRTSLEIRKQRLIKSRGYSEQKIASIMKNQLEESLFELQCDHIVENDQNIENLRRQISRILD